MARPMHVSVLAHQLDDLCVTDLVERLVPEANRPEPFQPMWAHDTIGLSLKRLQGGCGPHRRCSDDASRPGRPGPARGGDHRGAGRDTVVYDEHISTCEAQWRLLVVQTSVQLSCLRPRLIDSRSDLLVGHPVGASQIDTPPGSHRSDRVLGLQWMTDLADRNGVERRAENRGDLCRDHDTAASQADDDECRPSLALQFRGERPPARPPIGEERPRVDEDGVGHLRSTTIVRLGSGCPHRGLRRLRVRPLTDSKPIARLRRQPLTTPIGTSRATRRASPARSTTSTTRSTSL